METLNIAWYNVENLFDPLNHPEYKLDWDQNRYNKKIANIASVISEMHENSGPDLIGFCEIQSDQALKDIISNLPGGTNEFDIIHHNSPDIRAIDVGFIYRKSKLSNPAASAHNIRKRYPTRDIMDVKFDLINGKQAYFIGNHWPARSGGQYGSEPYRILVAENCSCITDDLYQNNADTNIIVMGDFNDEPFNRSVSEYLYAIRNRARVTARRNSSKSRPYLYNFAWLLMDEQSPGTFYYGSSPAGWNMLDQIMVSKAVLTGKNGIKAIDESFSIFKPKRIRDGSKPKAFRKKRNGWTEGFSDHFPITLKIKML
ncbi:MAG: hypothetical protein B6D61_10575 [Bacteroidetes bacterium 4484_249]|nr:MAG: hypothetical protein B6D61_10575 [Bacteroidetes bacterium 4484_249]